MAFAKCTGLRWNVGEQPVEGKVVMADANTIAIARTTDEVVNVHFPRAGYRVTVL